jgi:general secretion pathway protein M
MADQERQMIQHWKQTFSDFWEVRNARERAILAGGAIALLVIVLYLALISPALTGRERLARDLPQLRQQVGQLQELARETASLSGSSPAGVAPMSKETLEAELARRGLKAESVSVSGEIARLQLPGASFAALVNWLDEMQKSALVSTVEANIVALAQPDTVNATLTLRQLKSE